MDAQSALSRMHLVIAATPGSSRHADAHRSQAAAHASHASMQDWQASVFMVRLQFPARSRLSCAPRQADGLRQDPFGELL
jgi:hypothetical protein